MAEEENSENHSNDLNNQQEDQNQNDEQNNEQDKMDNDGEGIEVEVEDRGVNTDELPPEELQRLVDNNKELQEENNTSNIEHEIKEDNIANAKKEIIDELNEKDKIFELLIKSNNELKNKIEISNKKYQEILKKIETKKGEDLENKLNLEINEIDKEIKANNMETERYRKMIEQLKSKIEFKERLEKVSSIQFILKQETLKNQDLQNELNSLKRINRLQAKYIDNYDKENQITEKMELLNSEIKQNKDTIKDYQEKYTKLERFIRLVHEKIKSLEMLIKRTKEQKVENKKLFTKEELKDTLELINNLQNQINDKRNQLNNITKESEIKLHKLLSQNKQIELEYKEHEKLNKLLINKKNELKRNIKNINSKTINSNKFKIKPVKFISSISPKVEKNEIKEDEVEKKDEDKLNELKNKYLFEVGNGPAEKKDIVEENKNVDEKDKDTNVDKGKSNET